MNRFASAVPFRFIWKTRGRAGFAAAGAAARSAASVPTSVQVSPSANAGRERPDKSVRSMQSVNKTESAFLFFFYLHKYNSCRILLQHIITIWVIMSMKMFIRK